MSKHSYPTLYKRGSTGKVRFWTITVDGDNTHRLNSQQNVEP